MHPTYFNPMEGAIMSTVRFSIVISITEQDDRLSRLLQSILQQDQHTASSEVLIIAPQDMTVNDLEFWDSILSESRMHVFTPSADESSIEVKNSVISQCRGELIACLRPDYRLSPNYFARMDGCFSKLPHTEVLYPDYVRLSPVKGDKTINGYAPLPEFSDELLRVGNPVGPGACFRKSMWEECDGLRANTVYCEWDLWVQAALREMDFMHLSESLCSCDTRKTTFRERAEDGRGKAMIVINNQAFFHMHTVRWALAYLRGDAWAESWAFMRIPTPMEVVHMMHDHNIQKMGGAQLGANALEQFMQDDNKLKTI